MNASSQAGTVRNPLRIGFVPLNDCAPLVVADALGLFRRHGVSVVLSRELGWASIRARLLSGELVAAHAPGGLPFVLRAAPPGGQCECFTPLVLSLNGNAITLGARLREAGVRDAASLGRHIRSTSPARRLTLGIVSRYSSHAWLMDRFLRQAGIDPETEVDLAVVPPPQMTANLAAGHLDGFCAGEPWNSEAVVAGAGWIAATSHELAPFHPEKVLVCRRELEAQPEVLSAVVAALLEACALCDEPAHRPEILGILSRPEHVGLPADTLRRGWPGLLDCGFGESRSEPDFCLFHRRDANEPSPDKAAWVVSHFVSPTLRAAYPPSQLGRVFRADLHRDALRRAVRTP